MLGRQTVAVPHQRYLDGFHAATGERVRRGAEAPAGGVPPSDAPASPFEEQVKRALLPGDAFPRLLACAREDRPPDPADAFRFEWFGCFYGGPRQDAFRLRLRLPGGRLRRGQLTGLADAAQAFAGGWLETNALGGLDLPSVPVRCVADALRQIESLGLTTRGTGGDNVRAVRGGERDGLPPGAAGWPLYPLVCEVEQALAHSRACADLPGGCEVVFRAADEASPAANEAIVFQLLPSPATAPTLHLPWSVPLEEPAAPGFQLFLPGSGPLGGLAGPAQVVPALVALLGHWARGADRTDRARSSLAAFCRDTGAASLRSTLAELTGFSLLSPVPAPVYQRLPPAEGSFPLPAGRLLSGQLLALARWLADRGAEEIRLDGAGGLRVPPFGSTEAVDEARGLLSPAAT